MTAPIGQSREELSDDQRFRELSDRYAIALKSMGTRCIPYANASLPLFTKARPETKEAALAFLENALAIFDEIRAAGGDPRDNRTLLWRTLHRLRLVPEADLFDRLRDGNVVEIYSLPDHLHLAWNIKLLDCSSFTVEQLLCQPWWELSTRPPEVIAEFQKMAAALVSGELSKTIVPNVPVHRLQEQHSHELLTIEMTMNYISPLRRDHRNAGFVVVTDNRVVGSLRGSLREGVAL